MKLLAGTLYDPAARVQKATTSNLAMTALDTTNLRLTFTAPSNGIVNVHMRSSLRGAATQAMVMLGVLDGATIKGRRHCTAGRGMWPGNANNLCGVSANFPVTGLTGGQSYTWDAAYAVQAVVAATNLEYGGPDDTVATNAAGGFHFYVYDAPETLAAKAYDPASAATLTLGASAAMTALDTTNLRVTFTCPSNGQVFARIRTTTGGTATQASNALLGVLDGATIRCRSVVQTGLCNLGAATTTDRAACEAVMLVTGLTAGTSYTWDAAASCENGATNNNLKWGGADNNSGDTGWGATTFEILRTDAVPQMIASAT